MHTRRIQTNLFSLFLRINMKVNDRLIDVDVEMSVVTAKVIPMKKHVSEPI